MRFKLEWIEYVWLVQLRATFTARTRINRTRKGKRGNNADAIRQFRASHNYDKKTAR